MISLIDKNNLPQVAMEFMNDVHNEDVEIINELYNLILLYEQESNQKNKEAIDKKYEDWFAHTTEHFRGEEEKMKELQFPPYMMHKGEHDNALYIMDTIFRTWKKSNDITVLKNYMQNDLLPWLIHHIQTMDTVTAHFFHSGMSPCSIH
ncbi:MAG: hemerythrin family protein [Campylobacterales bacterium]|nr:hemerythrin family protein [Campylobacterales bacterium]